MFYFVFLLALIVNLVFIIDTYFWAKRIKKFKWKNSKFADTLSGLARFRSCGSNFDLLFFLFNFAELIFIVYALHLINLGLITSLIFVAATTIGMIAAVWIRADKYFRAHKIVAFFGFSLMIVGAIIFATEVTNLSTTYALLFWALNAAVLIPMVYSMFKYRTLPIKFEYLFFIGAAIWKVLIFNFINFR